MATRYLVKNVDESIEFFSKLGFRVVERWGPPFAMMSNDTDTIWLSGPETSAAKAMPDGRLPEPGGWNRIVVAVENIDSLAQELRESGVVFRNDGLKGPGGTQFLIEDPSGNPVEIFESRD